MKGERLLLIILAGTIVGVAALALSLTLSDDPSIPQIKNAPVDQITNPWVLKGVAAQRQRKVENERRSLLVTEEIERLRGDGVEGNLQMLAIQSILESRADIIFTDRSELYRRVARKVGGPEAALFFDGALRSPEVTTGLKMHAASLLAEMSTPEAQDVLFSYFQRVHVEDIAEDDDLQLQMRSIIRTTALMGITQDNPSAANTAYRILESILLSPIRDLPEDIRADALDMLGAIASEKSIPLLESFATDSKKINDLGFPKEKNSNVMKLAIYSLGRTQSHKGLEALVRIERVHENRELRIAVVEAVGNMGSKLIEPFANFGVNAMKRRPPSSDLQQLVVKALQRVIERENEDPLVRKLAVKKLLRIHTPQSTLALAAILDAEGESSDGRVIANVLDYRLGLKADNSGALKELTGTDG